MLMQMAQMAAAFLAARMVGDLLWMGINKIKK